MNSKDSKKKKWNIAIKNEIKKKYDMIKMLVVDINSIPKKKKKWNIKKKKKKKNKKKKKKKL